MVGGKVYLSVVTSMYNEEDNVDDYVKEVLKAFKYFKKSFEIIIVNNGSTDRTGDICEKLASKHSKKIKVVQLRPPSLGKGNGIRTGIERASGDFIALIDGDLEQYPADVIDILDKMEKENYDMIVGWRKNRKITIKRRVLSRIYNLIAKVFFDLPLKDAAGQPRVFRRNAMKDIKLESKRWNIEIELPHKVKKEGFKVGYTAVRHRFRHAGQSKIDMTQAYKIFVDLVKYRIGFGDF